MPDLTILLDVAVHIGLARKRRGPWNRFEDTQEAEFFEKVRAAYSQLARAEPGRFRIIDGSGTVAGVDDAVRNAVGMLVQAAAH